MEVFGDPRSLSCGHIFCKPCLEKLVKEQYRVDAVIEKYIICPECRCRDVFSYGETVDDLARPLSLRKLADFRDKIVTFLDSKTGKSSCDFCEETSQAAFYCYQCLLNLCPECLEEHNSQKAFLDHTTYSLKQDTKCKCKKNKPITAFCHDCQGMFCAVCIVKNHPKHHKTQDIKVAAAERREVLKEVIPSVKFQIEKFHTVKDTVEGVDKTVEIDYAAVEKQIDEQQDKIVDVVRNKLTELKTSLRETQSTEKQKLKVLIEENEDCLTNKLSLVRSMEELLEGSSDIELLQRSADFQHVIASQPFGNIRDGLNISMPKFIPTSGAFDDVDIGRLEQCSRNFPIAPSATTENDSVKVQEKASAVSFLDPRAPKLPPRPKTAVSVPDLSGGRSRKKERKQRLVHTPPPIEVMTPMSPSAPDLTPDPEAVPSLVSQAVEVPEERQQESSPMRLPRERAPKRRKLRIPAPGKYTQFRLVSELLNCESGLVKDFIFNQKQHQLYVSTDDNNEPIQVYDYGMQKLGSIGRGVVSDVQQLCIDEVANNVAIIADKGASIKLLNSFGQLKQVTTCSEITRVWDIDFCKERGYYVVAYQEATPEAGGCLNWGVAFIDPVSNSVARKSESTYDFHSIPNVCYLSHLEAIALSDHCCVKLFDLNGRLIGDIGDGDLKGSLLKDTCEGHGGHLITACEETMDIRALRFGAKGGDYYQYGLAHGQIIVTANQLLGGKPKMVDISKDGFLAVQTVGKYRPRRAHSRAPLIARLQIFSGSYIGH